MIISLENNKKYNGMVNDIRKGLYSHMDAKTFRPMVKDLDPNFPVSDDGKKISMRDITEDQLTRHTDFLKTMSIRQGLRLDYFTDGDIACAEEAVFTTSVSDQFEEEEGTVIAGVICSNCGCETIRGLTSERFDEIMAIMDGSREERMDPITESFLCVNCIKIKG
jgi:hypothetical protein